MSKESFKRQLRKAIDKAYSTQPEGGSFVISGSPENKKTLIEAAQELPEVSDAREIQLPNHHGTHVQITVEPLPEMKISYDGGKTFNRI